MGIFSDSDTLVVCIFHMTETLEEVLRGLPQVHTKRCQLKMIEKVDVGSGVFISLSSAEQCSPEAQYLFLRARYSSEMPFS